MPGCPFVLSSPMFLSSGLLVAEAQGKCLLSLKELREPNPALDRPSPDFAAPEGEERRKEGIFKLISLFLS